VFRTVAHAAAGATGDENIPRCSGRSPDRARCGMVRGGSVADRPQQKIRGFSRFGGRRQKPADPERGIRTASRPERWTIFSTGILAIGLILLWAGGDLWTTLRYHRSLTASGGLASHSDAINRLAEYLERGGLSAPLALDWGMDAQVRFLTAGRVNPIEAFGYGAVDAADPGFAGRVRPFLDNPAYVYLAHAPEATIFRGRVEALAALARQQGAELREEIRFADRSGQPLFVVYRAARLR